MPTDPTSAVSTELLDDFYSECEEHLGIIRESISLLELGTLHSAGDSVLQRLFRSYHTLKGNSGIIGLREAEQLTHAIEDFLRPLSAQDSTPSPEVVNLLMEGTLQFEQIIAAHRAHQPLPNVSQFLNKLEHAAEPPSESQNEHATAPQAKPVSAEGRSVWKISFTPSPGLNERGVNVNQIRSRLTQMGEITHAAPVIRPGGLISFEFTVTINGPHDDFGEWLADGVTATPVEVENPKSKDTAETPQQTPDSTAHNPFLAPSHMVRVDLTRLDELMRIAGEMVVQRARLDEKIARIENAHPSVDCSGLHEVNQNLERHLRDLRESIMRVRLVRVAEVFDRMPFVVRDLARETGKQIHLTTSGAQTEIDKFVVERLKDPFLHLVRNAVSHGIETAETRVTRGKPAEATIHLGARTVGDSVVIEISDDGGGVDHDQVIARARKLGLHVPTTPDDATILDLISMPGFSTRDEADMASGRGVGMAVVARALQEMGGTMSMESTTGKGTKFTLRLPLTLAIADAFVVTAGGQNFALPQSAIEEIIEMNRDSTQKIESSEMLYHRGGSLPLFCVATRFGLPASTRKSNPVVVVETERGKVGFIVDRVVCQREVVVRPIRDPLLAVPGISGATELGDGKPVLILDPPVLARSGWRGRNRPTVYDPS
jgi:two-component system chemotaxis sensor kinase CheA